MNECEDFTPQDTNPSGNVREECQQKSRKLCLFNYLRVFLFHFSLHRPIRESLINHFQALSWIAIHLFIIAYLFILFNLFYIDDSDHFVCPFKTLWIKIYFALLLSAFVCYFRVYGSDPGSLDLIAKKRPHILMSGTSCPSCGRPFSLRSHHCRTLDACVHKFDHYCVFLRTSIGDCNHLRFFGFIFLEFLLVVLTFAANCLLIGRIFYCTRNSVNGDSFVPVNLEDRNLSQSIKSSVELEEIDMEKVILSRVTSLSSHTSEAICGKRTGNDSFNTFCAISAIVCVTFLCLSLLFLLNLVLFHLYLAATNQTTFEILKGSALSYMARAPSGGRGGGSEDSEEKVERVSDPTPDPILDPEEGLRTPLLNGEGEGEGEGEDSSRMRGLDEAASQPPSCPATTPHPSPQPLAASTASTTVRRLVMVPFLVWSVGFRGESPEAPFDQGLLQNLKVFFWESKPYDYQYTRRGGLARDGLRRDRLGIDGETREGETRGEGREGGEGG